MSFADQIRRHSRNYQDRFRRVYRQSVEETVNDAQTATTDGGRMRVDTGFLRDSGGAALNQMPSGPSKQGETGQTGMSLAEGLARWQPGDTFNWGWSANYARPREYKDGFMRGATDKWTDTVNRVARSARNR